VRLRLLVCALVALALASPAAASAAPTLVPLGGAASPVEFDQPIHLVSAPGDADRLFVVERPGRVQEYAGGAVDLYADLTELVTCCSEERGLLSIALPPDFAATGGFYAAYTGKTDAGGALGDIHVDYFVPTGAEDGAVTRTRIITIDHSFADNHHGGQLQFGPDGYLYISTGDGGGAGDPLENGQDLDSLLGKILRIDPDPGAEGGDPKYTIPSGNPYAAGPGSDEIWASGLRNPWRFSFDRLTGDMVIGDVGQTEHEEIDFAPAPGRGAGANYGWSCREGLFSYTDGTPSANCAGAGPFTDPVFDYPHDDPEDGSANGCAITGGYVVRDPGAPELYGRYLYVDFCAGVLRSIDLGAPSPAASDRAESLGPGSSPAPHPVSFGEDACGRLYILSINKRILQLVGPGGPGCVDSLLEEPPPGGGPQPKGGVEPSTPKVSLRVHRNGRLAEVAVQAAPCGDLAGTGIELRRGGRKLRLRPMPRDCHPEFVIRNRGRSTFRAVLRRGGQVLARSRPAKLAPFRP